MTSFLLISFLVFTVNKTLQKQQRASNLTAKLLVAFVQQVSVLSTFRVGWPEAVVGLSGFATCISSVEMKSVSCLLQGSVIPSFVLEALVVVYVVPATLIVLIPLLMYLLHRVSTLGQKYLQPVSRKNLVTVLIVIYFFLLPLHRVEHHQAVCVRGCG